MKKSEMIEEIITSLELMRGVHNGYYVYPEDDLIAKAILDKLEKLGMLPPQIDNTHALPSGGYLGLDAALTKGLREWEPE